MTLEGSWKSLRTSDDRLCLQRWNHESELFSWAQRHYRIDVTAYTVERKAGDPTPVGPCRGGCKDFTDKGTNARFIRMTCKICGSIRNEERHPPRQDPASCFHRHTDYKGSNAHMRKTYCVDCGTYIDSVPRLIVITLEAARSASPNRVEELASRVQKVATITKRQLDLATRLMLGHVSRLSDTDYVKSATVQLFLDCSDRATELSKAIVSFRDRPMQSWCSSTSKNAFNSVDRSAVLCAVRDSFPEIAPWADLCYKSPSSLNHGGRHHRQHQRRSTRRPAWSCPLRLRHSPRSPQGTQLDPLSFPWLGRPLPFYLDDGVLAGDALAISLFFRNQSAGLASIGLDIALDKTEVLSTCSATQSSSPADFPGCSWNSSRNFKLLGAAIGNRQWCEHLLSNRVAKASALLQAIGRYGDAHGASTLLRSCAGWAKILDSCGTVPPALQLDALAQADADIRGALGRLVGSPSPTMTGASLV